MYLPRVMAAATFTLLLAACDGSAPPAPPPSQAAAPQIDASAAATISAVAVFEGTPPPAAMVRLDADPKCVTEAGASARVSDEVQLDEGHHLQNVFVYLKDGLGRYTFPIPADPVVLDQRQCRYSPRVFGIRVGQPLVIRNSDPLLHNVRAGGQFNQPFNVGQPQGGMSFTRVFATSEVMVPIKCDVHAWMRASAGVVDHPFFGVTDGAGRVSIAGLPPGTYTVEAWHDTLGTTTQQVTVGAKETTDVTFTFTR